MVAEEGLRCSGGRGGPALLWRQRKAALQLAAEEGCAVVVTEEGCAAVVAEEGCVAVGAGMGCAAVVAGEGCAEWWQAQLEQPPLLGEFGGDTRQPIG